MPAIPPVQDSVDVPLPPVMVLGVNAHDRLVEFDATARATDAENPLTGVKVTAEVPAEPAILVTAVGLALMVKS